MMASSIRKVCGPWNLRCTMWWKYFWRSITLLCTRDQSCLWDYHINLTEKKCQWVWAVLSWNLPKKLRTSQTFINCDLKDRLPQMGLTFLKSLTNFLFRTTFKSMLGWVIWPEFWILKTKFFQQISTQNCSNFH